jgi:hypothetical protein
MLDSRMTIRLELMPPKSSTKKIPSSRICHQITLKSKGHKPGGSRLDLHVSMGLTMAKCAKPDEYNVWLMFEVLTMFPTMVEDHVMSPE